MNEVVKKLKQLGYQVEVTEGSITLTKELPNIWMAHTTAHKLTVNINKLGQIRMEDKWTTDIALAKEIHTAVSTTVVEQKLIVQLADHLMGDNK